MALVDLAGVGAAVGFGVAAGFGSAAGFGVGAATGALIGAGVRGGDTTLVGALAAAGAVTGTCAHPPMPMKPKPTSALVLAVNANCYPTDLSLSSW